MGYFFTAKLYMSSESPDYWSASSALHSSHANDEVKTFGELRRRLGNAVTYGMPDGAVVRTERVYRMVRGYEPGKPRSGSTDQEKYWTLADRGSGYDPKLGRARPPRWKEITYEQARSRLQPL